VRRLLEVVPVKELVLRWRRSPLNFGRSQKGRASCQALDASVPREKAASWRRESVRPSRSSRARRVDMLIKHFTAALALLSPRTLPPRLCDAPWLDLSGDGGCLFRVIRSTKTSDPVAASPRTFASVHYKATLEDGTVISDSRAMNGEPLEIRVGMKPSEGVPGWDLALPNLCVGEVAELVCKPKYAFGDAGKPPLIPPEATARFELELLGVRDLLGSNNTEDVNLADRYANLMAKEEEYGTGTSEEAANEQVVDVTDLQAEKEAAEEGEAKVFATEPKKEMKSGEGASMKVANGRHWIPPKRTVEVAHADGYAVKETEDEIEVRIKLPDDLYAKDLKVSIAASTLSVIVRDNEVLGGKLCGELRVDDCSWSIDRDEPPQATLQLDLMKKRPTRKMEPLWGYLFAEEREGASP
jgi:FK506-binding protein 1